MKKILILIAAALANLAGRRQTLALANIAEGTHEGSVTRLTDAAISSRHLLYKVGTDASHIAACGASDVPIGTVADEAAAAEENVSVDLLGIHKSTRLMVASEAIDAGEHVYTAANGKIQDLPTAAATYYEVGVAITSSSADGDLVEVAHCVPRKTVVT